MKPHAALTLGLVFLTSCQAPKPIPPKDNVLEVAAWPTNGTSYVFPERSCSSPDYPPVTGTTGVCFSGGGTRALSATAGQLRALVDSGLIERTAYISSVSGGSWASTAFTYYREGARNDAQFLGPVMEPQEITQENLNELDPYSLGHTATSGFKHSLFATLKNKASPEDQAWIRAVGETFFEPFGIYDAEVPAFFSLNAATVTRIRARNPSLNDTPFHVVRNNGKDAHRPYLIINSCIVWPVDDAREENLVGFEYTPLYSGSAYSLALSDESDSRHVGGGYIESFAMGSGAPLESRTIDGSVRVLEPGRPFSLSDASGASSSAYASFLDRFDPDLSPFQYTWHMRDGLPGSTRFDAFGDGGNVENFGLLALLRRPLTSIVVFVNTSMKLDLDYDPSHGPPSSGQIDSSLPQLFGVPVLKKGKPTHPFPNNTVFSREQLAPLVRDLQAKKRAGKSLVSTTHLRTTKNDWWGIPAGKQVKICWVYLDRVPEWEAQLREDIQADIAKGNRKHHPGGPVRFFPNYRTIGENPHALVQLTNPQVNLLGHLTHWVVANSDEVRDALTNP